MRARRLLLWLMLVSACIESNDASSEGRVVTRDRRDSERVVVGGSDTSCKNSSRPIIASEGLDALAIGAPVSLVRSACRVVRDTVELGAEAMPEHRLYVQFGSDIVVATVDSGRIWRIAIETPTLRTSDSLGVGSTLAEVLASGTATGLVGEGALFVQPGRHCGLSLRLQHDLTQADLATTWTDSALRRLPGYTRVAEVLIVGCQQSIRNP